MFVFVQQQDAAGVAEDVNAGTQDVDRAAAEVQHLQCCIQQCSLHPYCRVSALLWTPLHR